MQGESARPLQGPPHLPGAQPASRKGSRWDALAEEHGWTEWGLWWEGCFLHQGLVTTLKIWRERGKERGVGFAGRG